MFVASNTILRKALGLLDKDASEAGLAPHKASCHMSVPIPWLIEICVNLDSGTQVYPAFVGIFSLILYLFFLPC